VAINPTPHTVGCCDPINANVSQTADKPTNSRFQHVPAVCSDGMIGRLLSVESATSIRKTTGSGPEKSAVRSDTSGSSYGPAVCPA